MWAGSEQECDLSTTNRTCTYVGGKQKNTFKLLIDIHLFDDTLEKILPTVYVYSVISQIFFA